MENDVDIQASIKINIYWNYPAKNEMEKMLRDNIQIDLQDSVSRLEKGLEEFLISTYKIKRKGG